jgi:carboxylate-amine ligase
MAERYPAAAAGVDSEYCGCHIHVGDIESDEAVALSSRLRPWLPVLQAAAANSPFADGRYRRCASWRHYEMQVWPTVGPTPLIPPGGYEALASDLVSSGILLDRKMIYWYARPSEHQPTLEIRVPDVNADVEVPLLLAMLTRALAMVLRAEDRQGAPDPRPTDAEVREAHRQAATLGLAGLWTHPDTGQEMPLSAGLQALVERSMPALDLLGETRLVQDLLRNLTRRGTGAQRQQAVYRRRNSLTDVVDDLAARTVLA